MADFCFSDLQVNLQLALAELGSMSKLGPHLPIAVISPLTHLAPIVP
jgi:hypothetical protein